MQKEDMTVENATRFLHSTKLSNDIVFEPSVFIFHKIHSVYFFFREEEKKEKENHRHTLRSILKKGLGLGLGLGLGDKPKIRFIEKAKKAHSFTRRKYR